VCLINYYETWIEDHIIYITFAQDILLNLLISAKDLYDRVSKSKNHTIIIDTRTFSEYKSGHVPRAINVDLFQLHWFDTSKRGIKEFNRQTRMLLSHTGIQRESYVVIYDNISGISAARGVWLLLYFSHKKVSILDGGFEKWKKEGYPIELKSNPLKYSPFKGRVDKKVLATAREVKRSLNNKKVSIVDARSSEEFNGSDVRAIRRGHIPSAINIDWENNIENGIFKGKRKLSGIYSKIPKNAQIITYCQGGYRAANAFLAVKLLGYKKVKMYLASWGEWGNKLNLPTE
jgi:thiosulfate/3-mercaptopyruvate sulfurtransferase